MKCNDVRIFLSEICQHSVSMQIRQADIDFLCTNGYLSAMRKEEYDRALAEVSNLTQMIEEAQNERMEQESAEATLEKEESKAHSILFHLEGKEKKEADLEKVESQRNIVSKEEADLVERDSKINELIQKKSIIDRMVQYDGRYLSLTDRGVITLNDLNVRNYRVSDYEFSDFIEESRETSDELRSMAERGGFYVSILRNEFLETDLAQLWSVSIGLAKLQGDQTQISQRFLNAIGILQHSDSTIENKMMAAEIITSFGADPTQYTSDFDLQNLSESLVSLEQELRHEAEVPKEISAGIAATIMFGRRSDGTFPTDRFTEFSRMTHSHEAAAILSVVDVPSDYLADKFQSFRDLFRSWGYESSEDTELASAYLSVSDRASDDVKTEMPIILDALKNHLEYPCVAAAMLALIPTLDANEILDLMEKASSLLGSFATSLERPELICLSVRMIQGIENELVMRLDPTAKIMKTPMQFRYIPSYIFYRYYAPVIIAHSSYFSTFSGMRGVHPAHVHGFWGFVG